MPRFVVDYWNSLTIVGKKITVGVSALFIAALLYGWLLWYQSTYYSHASATVTGFQWARQVHVQKINWDWDNSRYGCSDDSRNCDSRFEVVGYHQVATGQSCSGQGTYQSCSTTYTTVADWGYVWYYQHPVWHDEYTAQSGDLKQSTPYWPTVHLVTTGTDSPERVGGTDEQYLVLFTDVATAKKTYSMAVAYPQWKAYVAGTGYTLKVHDSEAVGAVMN